MRIAIPTAQGKLCQHFGHCEIFTFCDIDEVKKEITKMEEIVPPEHVPGIIPPWVAKQGATLVLAGGMGARAQELFNEQNIKVVAGCPSMAPDKIINAYLSDTLVLGVNTCDH